jgi:hypothetical protein
MASKPFAFGIRLRDKERTLKVWQKRNNKYVVEDRRSSGSSKREHGSLGGAIRDAASTWRHRLN